MKNYGKRRFILLWIVIAGKVISIRLIYIVLIVVVMAIGITIGVEYRVSQKSKIAAESDLGTVEQEEVQIADAEDVTRTGSTVEARSEDLERTSSDTEDVEDTINYIPISEITISQSMDLTARTGVSRDDFITLIAGVKEDTSGFFEENAGTIYDLCAEYSLNEIFFCGLISAESGWTIASNHRSTHNYISLMSNGKLISYSSVESGLREAARVLHTNYLSPGGKYYYGKTLSAMKTKFCPSSSTWVSLVYGRMQQIVY